MALLLITGTILIVVNKGYIGKKDISSKIYDIELSILREIELNPTLRESILGAGDPPLEWEDIPYNVRETISDRIPDGFECKAKICGKKHAVATMQHRLSVGPRPEVDQQWHPPSRWYCHVHQDLA